MCLKVQRLDALRKGDIVFTYMFKWSRVILPIQHGSMSYSNGSLEKDPKSHQVLPFALATIILDHYTLMPTLLDRRLLFWQVLPCECIRCVDFFHMKKPRKGKGIKNMCGHFQTTMFDFLVLTMRYYRVFHFEKL